MGPDGQPIAISSFGHVSDSAEGLHFMADHQTVNSTAMNSTHVGTTNLMSSSLHPNAQSQGQVGFSHHAAHQYNQVKRVQSATRQGGLGLDSSMTTMMGNYDSGTRQMQGVGGGLNQTQGSAGHMTGACHTEMGQMTMGVGTAHQERRSMLQRPTKSAANKYRHLMPGAIAEEIDYTMSNSKIMVGGNYEQQRYQRVGGQTLFTDDLDSVDHSRTRQHPSGLQIHRNERRSAVRLKHNDTKAGGTAESQAYTTIPHTVSQGAGVLLGNMQYGADESSLRELNDSKTSGNLKSVYAMRISHSNLAQRTGSKPNQNATQAKRKHLKSAVPRTSKPASLTIHEGAAAGNGGNLSQQEIDTLPYQRKTLTGKHLNALSTLSTKYTAANQASAKQPPQPARQASTIGYHASTLQPRESNQNVTMRTQSHKAGALATIQNPPASQLGYMTNISQTIPASATQRPPAARQSSALDQDIRIKGKGSIRTLIRLANTRAQNDEQEYLQSKQ